MRTNPTRSPRYNNNKINELVDVVNKLETMAKNTNSVLKSLVQENNIHEKQIDELQMKVEPEKCEIPADPYAEQRKWIGKLCWFWFNGKNNKNHYGKLKQIDPFSKHHYTDEDLACWDFCEPVKPDDNIIYKGE